MSDSPALPESVPVPPARLSCTAELSSLPALLALLDTYCECLGVDAASHHDLHLMVEEACVNVMSHAYPPGAPGPLTLQVESTRSADRRLVEVTLEDRGRPFDPLSVSTPDQTGPLEDLPVGGLGVHLIRTLSHTRRYRHDPERGNVLTLGRFLPPVAQA